MNRFPQPHEPRPAAAQFHLLGQVDFAACLALQERLVFEATDSNDSGGVVLLCEHPPLVTVGRSGSRVHIRLSDHELDRRHLPLKYVGRGGGCIAHAPGQLAVYPIVPLEHMAWTVGQYVRRLQAAVVETLSAMGVRCETVADRLGVWGRTGQLAAGGVAVRNWVAYHGLFINVHPEMRVFGHVDTTPPALATGKRKATMSCLLAELGRGVRMTRVRAALIAALASALSWDRYHLHTGHPLLPRLTQATRQRLARAG
jgi:lipoyl(octanoyl) transferase